MASTACLCLLRGLHCASLDTSHIPQTLIILLVFTAVHHKYFMSLLFASLSFGFAQRNRVRGKEKRREGK